MSDTEDLEIFASGMALQQVSSWLGVDAESVLAQETDPAIEAMFTKPHPLLLGLGAKYLSHKSMETSGVELKLKHKLRKSAGADEGEQYQPAQLERHQHKRKKLEQQPGGPRHIQQQQQEQSDSDSDDEGRGKLRKGAAAAAGGKQQSKVLDRKQLLQVPLEHLSKWQRKRMNQKAKKQQQQKQHVQQ